MAAEDTERAAVVAEALTWLNTPYLHRQQVKGVGVDCVRLPIAVFLAAGLIADGPALHFEYSAQWGAHSNRETFLELLALYCREITQVEARPGDLAIYKFGRIYHHSAIVLAWPSIVHAVAEAGVVLDDGDNLAIWGHAPKGLKFYRLLTWS